MATRYFVTSDGWQVTRTSSGKGNKTLPDMPVEAGDWVEIDSVKFFWLKKKLEVRASQPRAKSRIDLAVDLAKEGPEAVHKYCMEHYGHGSGVGAIDFVGGV